MWTTAVGKAAPVLTAVAETVAVGCLMCSLIAISAIAHLSAYFLREREYGLARAREARNPRIVSRFPVPNSEEAVGSLQALSCS
jgi:hypothetical protein